MAKVTFLSLFLIIIAGNLFSQSIDDSFSQVEMIEDFQIFKDIRLKANSGLYKYRTKNQIDSIYNWADEEIKKSSSFLDFYNIICKITDFEGSVHNNTMLPGKVLEALRDEESGYFPYPLKYIENKWIINYKEGELPLGSEIVSINNEKIDNIIQKLNKYFTTDGLNTNGKRISLEINFSKFYRFQYGLNSQFTLEYKARNSEEIKQATLTSVSYRNSNKNVNARYSKPFDNANYKKRKENEKYHFKTIDKKTGILTLNSFSLGNEKDPMHLRYTAFLDSVFTAIKNGYISNLIVDIRYNGGGDDPNDLITYSYLTQRNFQENTKAWISFKRVPYIKYASTKIPRFLRPLGAIRYNRAFQKEFPNEVDGKFYQDSTSGDHKIRTPNENAFKGNIYLLVGPRVASAGSLFASMLAGNKNTIVVGEETMGGYYGHNGHTPLGYILPKSKIGTYFFVVNLEQDVQKRDVQIVNRGIIPDHNVVQLYDDYLEQKDTQLDYVIDLIKKTTSE